MRWIDIRRRRPNNGQYCLIKIGGCTVSTILFAQYICQPVIHVTHHFIVLRNNAIGPLIDANDVIEWMLVPDSSENASEFVKRLRERNDDYGTI